jgi:hypothetical protein
MINPIGDFIKALNAGPVREAKRTTPWFAWLPESWEDFSYLCAFYFAMCCLGVVVLLPIAVLLLAGYACGHLAGVW